MKRIISLLLTIILIVGMLPTNVFAAHQHYYEYEDSIFTQHPHRMSLYACECGKKIELDRAYLAGCRECGIELCNQGFHTYCDGYNYADREHFNVYCVCGDSMTIPIVHVMYMEQDMNNICQDFNIEIANEKGHIKQNLNDIFKAINEDIDSLFSESVTAEHPHSGVYETRVGNQVFLDCAMNGECRYCITEELCDLYNAHSGLYDYEVYDDYVEFLCYCDKPIRVPFSKLNDFFEDRWNDNIDICENINFDLAEEVYYSSHSNYDISVTDDTEYIEEEFEESTLGGTVSSPQTYSNGKLAVTAELKSNYNIRSCLCLCNQF